MLYFFDESGDFAVPPSGTHKCGVVCGVVVPETAERPFREAFEAFVASLAPKEKPGSEPKGHLLSDSSRRGFCEMLNAWPQVLVTPTTLDLSDMPDRYRDGLGGLMKAKLFQDAARHAGDPMRPEIEELGRRWSNLSANQGLRLMALASSFHEAVHHSVVFLAEREYDACWNSATFCVDAVQKQPLARETQVFQLMVLMWLTAWSRWQPFETIAEVHTKDHPFEQNFCSGEGIDLGKLLIGNIQFASSSGCWGLQVADICSNTVFQAVHDLNNWDNRLTFFRLLMRNCPYGAARGPGLMTIGPPPAGWVPLPKYRLLCQVMEARGDGR